MRIISLFVFSFFIMTNVAVGQTAALQKADKYFQAYDYKNAIAKYSKIKEKTTFVNRRLGDSYYAVRDYESAEVYYHSVVTSDGALPDDFYKFSFILKLNGRYIESSKWMKKFNQLRPEDTRGQYSVENPNYFVELLKPTGEFEITNLKMNTPFNDFSPSYYLDKIVFTSDRTTNSVVERKWNWDDAAFLMLYTSNVLINNELDSAKHFDSKTESKFHDGPASFSKDGKVMVFTRDNLDSRSSDGSINLILLYSEHNGKKWTRPARFTFNSAEYSCGHGALSADGKTVYFVSNMPGGHGGTDIYRCKKLKSGNWSKPINMGASLNTEGNEMFPSIHENGKLLFFASNGHLGLGGQDIFAAEINGYSVGEVRNLGVPINSNRDDFGMVVDSLQQTGYFSSDRAQGVGGDDIYAVKISKPFKFGLKLKGTSKDQNGDVLANTSVNLYNDEGAKVATKLTNDFGVYVFDVNRNKNYTIIGSKDAYFDGVNAIDTYTDKQEVWADIILAKIKAQLSVFCLVTEAGTNRPIEGARLIIKDLNTNKVIDTLTMNQGIRYDLVDYNLNDKLILAITVEKDGYFTKNANYAKLLDHEGAYNVHEELDVTLTKIPVGGDLSQFIDINPIYFDLAKSYIRVDAARELDKIVEVMNDNPTMEVELGSHTDNRGSDASNLSLSDRRAKASADYIKKRITNPSRISGKGYGETKFKVVTEDINKSFEFLPVGQVLDEKFINSLPTENMKETAHQINRRTEFIILHM